MGFTQSYWKLGNAVVVGIGAAGLMAFLCATTSTILYKLTSNALSGGSLFLSCGFAFLVGFVLYLWNTRGRGVEPEVLLWVSKRRIKILGIEFTTWAFWFTLIGFAFAMLLAKLFDV